MRPPTEAELSAWMANRPAALCILCGEASGNGEILDFDAQGELFERWCQEVRAAAPGLLERLVLSSTQSGGRHAFYLCEVPVSGNLKLAQRRSDGKIVTLIETRGEGGLFLCAPTPGYEVVQGDLANPSVLTQAERDALLQAAWELNEYLPPVVDGPKGSADMTHIGNSLPDMRAVNQRGPLSAEQPACAADNAHNGHCSSHSAAVGTTGSPCAPQCGALPENAGRPGDDFNSRGDVRTLLQQAGWSLAKAGDNEYWRRPGKDSGWSATLKDRVFYVFSANAEPFAPNRAYSPFSVYALLTCGGNYEQAARSLRLSGYGGESSADSAPDVDISAIVNQGSRPVEARADDGLAIRRLQSLIHGFTGLNAPIIHGLLREGETMNIIASPKMGKSWFVSSLAISIASGLNWLGLTVEPGRVLHIDNELHSCTSAYRYGVISDAMNVPHRLYSDNIDMVSLRGSLRDLYALGSLFERVEPGTYKLVIIDAFYRTLPCDTDENDNGAIANLYNKIDHYAARLKCAFVLIHHTSKGNQSGKAVTDVGAGAGSQSRAADAHLVLRPHETDGTIILESAVRSWPPMKPLALLWKWPLFAPTEHVDTSALLGAAKPKAKPKEVNVADFVEQCIAVNDPCSKRSVCYEASQRLGLSDRKAEEMLDLAIERGLASRIRTGSSMRYVKNRPGVSGDKALWTAALLAHDPEASLAQIAQMVGATERRVRQVRDQVAGLVEMDVEMACENKGLTAEMDCEMVGNDFRKKAVSFPKEDAASD